MTKPSWQERVGATRDALFAAPSGETVDAILASTKKRQLKLGNLDHVRARIVTMDAGDINFGAIQLHEDTIRAIAEECGLTPYLKRSPRDERHLDLRSISKEDSQLYTQPITHKNLMVPDAGTHVSIKRPKESKEGYHLAVGKFMSEITRLREGLFAIADGRKPQLVSGVSR